MGTMPAFFLDFQCETFISLCSPALLGAFGVILHVKQIPRLSEIHLQHVWVPGAIVIFRPVCVIMELVVAPIPAKNFASYFVNKEPSSLCCLRLVSSQLPWRTS